MIEFSAPEVVGLPHAEQKIKDTEIHISTHY